MKTFEKEIEVRWSDCDPNMHVRHSAYYEYGAHIRICFFRECGYAPRKLSELNLGPILFKEECTFIKEIRPDETIRINMLKGEMTEDAARWSFHHELFNENGDKVAHLTVKGAWMDANERKLTVPPKDLAQKFHELPKGNDYVYSKTK